jgi:putative ABC transport system permease protein
MQHPSSPAARFLPAAMLGNYWKTAWRNLRKNRTFSLINGLGLAIGMAACLLILRYVSFEQSYDRFHKHADRLYRVPLRSSLFSSGATNISAANHPGVGQYLKAHFPEVEAYARLAPVTVFSQFPAFAAVDARGDKKSFIEESVFLADSAFLTMFNFPLRQGDPVSALRAPYAMVVTASVAEKYFGTTQVLGKILEQGPAKFTITGVLEDLPENTHFQFDLLVSFATTGFLHNLSNPGLEYVWKWPEFYTYVQLAPKADPQKVAARFPAFIERYVGPFMRKYHFDTHFLLQPVTDIHLRSQMLKEFRPNSSRTTVWFLTAIAWLILVIAGLNYVNLSTAKALERAGEVGLRKAIGAHREQLVGQFLLESFLLNTMAVLLALTLVQAAWPYFGILTGRQFTGIGTALHWWQQPEIRWLVLGFVFLGPLLSGLYPAFVLSSFDPLQVMKGKNVTSTRRFGLRGALVGLQFTISMLLMVGAFALYQQLRFMQQQDLGFASEQVVVVKMPAPTDSTFLLRQSALKEYWLRQAPVRQVTASTSVPGKEIHAPTDYWRADQPESNRSVTYTIRVDEDFLHTYQMQLAAGRFFAKDRPADRQGFVLNEQAIALLGFKSPSEALGRRIVWHIGGQLKDWEGEIIGVLKNHHQRSLNHGYEPMLLYVLEGPPSYYSVRVNTTDLKSTLAALKSTYGRIFPGQPFAFFFLDDFFDQQYRADRQFGTVFGVFTGLAIFIAGLGLFGLSAYAVVRRTKEIGIRKVHGASVKSIIGLLSLEFMQLVGVASLVALPLSYLVLQRWLANYAFHIQLHWWLFAVPLAAVLLIALATVSYQTIKAARLNPVKALRYE